MTSGVYPGTFNPPTVGHMAIVDAAVRQHHLTAVDLIVSREPLAKAAVTRPQLDHRIEVIEASMAYLTQRGVRVQVLVTALRLIADIAEPYDVVIMGADKWTQVNDLSFYADVEERDRALARLPTLAIAPRGPNPLPDGATLTVDPAIETVSSTAARAGESHLMTTAARAFDDHTGAWSDPARYDRWLRGR